MHEEVEDLTMYPNAKSSDDINQGSDELIILPAIT